MFGKTKTKPPKGAPQLGYFTDKERKNAVEWEALRVKRKNTNWARVLMISALIIPLAGLSVALNANHDMQVFAQKFEAKYALFNGEHPGRDAAMKAVAVWLDGKKGLFTNGAANLAWVDAYKAYEVPSDDKDKPKSEYWVHVFNFTDLTDGSTRTVSQLVLVQGALQAPIGMPSILAPALVASDNSGSSKPKDYGSFTAPATLTSVVKAWAKTYVGKDSAAFTVSVADPNTKNAYTPANIGKLNDAQILWSVPCDKNAGKLPKSTQEDDSKTPDYALVGVTLTVAPYPPASSADKRADSKQDDKPQPQRMSLMLLVNQPASGSAHIVDWGSLGAVGKLHPYAQAVSADAVQQSGSNNDDANSADAGNTSANSTDASTTDSSNANANVNADSQPAAPPAPPAPATPPAPPAQ